MSSIEIILPTDVREVVKMAIDSCGSDPLKIKTAVEPLLDGSMKAILVDLGLGLIIQKELGRMNAIRPKASMNPRVEDMRTRSQKTQESYRAAAQQRLMDYSLLDGMKLADARRPDLEKQFRIWYDIGTSALADAYWLRLILLKFRGSDVRVSQILTESDLRQLRDKAEAQTRTL